MGELPTGARGTALGRGLDCLSCPPGPPAAGQAGAGGHGGAACLPDFEVKVAAAQKQKQVEAQVGLVVRSGAA